MSLSPARWHLACVFLFFVGVGCAANAQTFTWDGEGGDGLWSNPSNWDPDGIPSGPGTAAIVEAPGPTIQDFSYQVGRLVVTNTGFLINGPSAELSFATPVTGFINLGEIVVLNRLSLGGSIDNVGNLFVGSDEAARTAVLNIQEFGATIASDDLFRTGEIELGFRSEIRGAGGERLDLRNQEVHGFGSIVADVTVQSDTVIAADVKGERLIMRPPVGSTGISNQGTLEAIGAGILQLLDVTIDNSGGIIRAVGSAVVELEGAHIAGGELRASDDGQLVVPATSEVRLSDVRLTQNATGPDRIDLLVKNRSDLYLSGTIENAGDIEVFNNSVFPNFIILAEGTTTLSGGGRIQLSGSSNIELRGPFGSVLTLERQRIQGRGSVGVGRVDFNIGLSSMIEANVAEEALTLSCNNFIENAGTLRAGAGATLQIRGGDLINHGLVESLDGAIFGNVRLTNNVNGSLEGGQYFVVATAGDSSMSFSGPPVTDIDSETWLFLSGRGSLLAFEGVPLEQSIELLSGFLELFNRNFLRTADGPLQVEGRLLVRGTSIFDVGDELIVGPEGQLDGDGTIRADNTIASGGIGPGSSPGILALESNVTLEDTSHIDVELAGEQPGDSHDQLDVLGALSLDGELRIQLIDGFVPAPEHSFEIIRAEEIVGSFINVNADRVLLVDGRGSMRLVYEDTSISVTDFIDLDPIFADGFEKGSGRWASP